MGGLVEADADRLAGRLEAGIGRVDVELEGIGQVPGDQRAHAVADVGRGLQHPHHVVEVGEAGLAERATFGVQHLDGGAAGADVDMAAADLEPAVGAETGQGDPAGRAAEGRLDQAAWKGHAAVVAASRPSGLQRAAQPVGRPGHADLFQDGDGRIDDEGQVLVSQRPETAAGIGRARGSGCGLASLAAVSRPASRVACHGGPSHSGRGMGAAPDPSRLAHSFHFTEANAIPHGQPWSRASTPAAHFDRLGEL